MSEPSIVEDAVVLDGISHQYTGRTALDDVSLSVRRGDFVALLGPNGSGKSTLFKILSTLIRPSTGTARVMGFATHQNPGEVRRRLGVVFQHPALDAELTVRENLQHHAALHGLHGRALRDRIDELLAAFSLMDRAKDRIKTLSGGMVRRVDLVRGLLHGPAVLLLDEPTVGLDPAARRSFWSSLDALRARHDTTVLLATHLVDEADYSDQTIVLDRGRVVVTGAPADLRQALGNESVWIDTTDAVALSALLETDLRLKTRHVGSRLLLTDPGAIAALPEIHRRYGNRIAGLALRNPTLEDVLLYHTGHGIDGEVPV